MSVKRLTTSIQCISENTIIDYTINKSAVYAYKRIPRQGHRIKLLLGL